MINEVLVCPSLLTVERNLCKKTCGVWVFLMIGLTATFISRLPPPITCSREISHVARSWLAALLVSEVTGCF